MKKNISHSSKSNSKIDEDLVFPLPAWFLAWTLLRYVFFSLVLRTRYMAQRFFFQKPGPHSDPESPRQLPLCIGHRGCRGEHPENSRSAFEYAQKWADGFELDTQLTQDGVAIVLHDSTLDRTTNGKGRVDGKNHKDLEKVSLENGESIPDLAEILETFAHQTGINVEIKKETTVHQTRNSAREVGHIIRNHLEKNHSGSNRTPFGILVSSFSPLCLYYTKKYYPEIPRAQLVADPISSSIPGWKGKLLGSQFFGIAWNAEAFVWEKSLPLREDKLVEKMHQFQIKSWVYTSNSQEEWIRFGKMGVDGIITDLPREWKEFHLTDS